MHNLKEALRNTSPIHDTPIGMVHPYWARKPLNVIETIIEHLTEEGDVVIDPFMGSGTTIFAALKTKRSAIGSDINPLSRFIVAGLLEVVSDSATILPEMEELLREHAAITLPWFHVEGEEYVERSRYNVSGEFAGGEFTLVPTETVTKVRRGDKWTSRRVHKSPPNLASPIGMADYIEKPVDFSRAELRANSRIAIPAGATLAHYFTAENQASINVLLSLIDQSTLAQRFPTALRLLLSSALPLLRLSDKKASSQWPYWRPKLDLTSRNPSMVLAEKLRQIRELSVWGEHNLGHLRVEDAPFTLLGVPAQALGEKLGQTKAQLVLTDPPYGDQVPYLEYSALWTEILGLSTDKDALRHEIVKSDAKTRKTDTDAYYQRLRSGFLSSASIVKEGGHLGWFYQDQDLHCWETISSAAEEIGMDVLDVIPIPKQRRSLKTVTSPNTTLDGDLLCIFRRGNPTEVESSAPSSIDDLKRLVAEEGSYFEKYAALITACLKGNMMAAVATRYGTVKRALAAMA